MRAPFEHSVLPKLIVPIILAMSIVLAGCDGCNATASCVGSECGAGGDGGAGGSAGTAFDVWRATRDALRASPDHLPAEADRLVAAADPDAIFTFVRDQIVTYPPSSDGFGGARDATRWGVRATLRGGAGTPREKAELLAELYTRAGLEAEVVRGAPDLSRVDPRAILLRNYSRNFEPDLTADDIAQWRAALGWADAAPAATIIDPAGTQTAALAADLMTHLGGMSRPPFDFDSLTAMPVVRVRLAGSWTFANPSVPGAAFGDSMTVATPTSTSAANAPPSIRVRLEAARADAPFDRFLLVEGNWGVEDVAGRRIRLSFVPVGTLEQLKSATAADVTAFIPALSVNGPDLTNAEVQALGVVGDAFSLAGDLFQVSATDEVTVNGESLGTGVTDPVAIANVQTLTVAVQPNAFTRITTRVSARDAADQQIPGLGADAFAVLEEGQPVSFTLRRNTAPPPRVVLLMDSSTSVPAAFRGAGAVTLADQIITSLYADFANAWIRVGTVNFGVSFATGTWATNETDAHSQAAWLATAVGSSEIFAALAEVAAQRPTVTIFITDGDTTDTLEPEYQTAISTGAPILTIGVGTVVQANLDLFAQLSGGLSVLAVSSQDAIDAALAEIAARSVEDYILSYRAPLPGPATRTVRVEVDSGRVFAESTYAVPAAPASPPDLSGLYLTVRVGGREVTRTLAGFAGGFTTAYVPITAQMRADVESLVFGGVTLAVEGAAPNPSVWLADWFEEKLTLEPLWLAQEAGDEAQMEAAIADGFSLTRPELFLIHSALPKDSTATSLTFETGVRIAAMVQKAKFGVGWQQQLDLFALSHYATASDDPTAAWAATLERTAYLALVEAALFTTSTFSELDGLTLRRIDSGAAASQLTDLPAAVVSRWSQLEDPFGLNYQMLLPDAGTPFAFWAVHEQSGTIIGILPDGSGGASREELEANLEATNQMLDLIGDVGGLFGASVGVWVELEKTKAALVTKATILLATGIDPGGWGDPARDLACSGARSGIGNVVPGMGSYFDVIGRINDAGSLMGLGSVPTLPGCD